MAVHSICDVLLCQQFVLVRGWAYTGEETINVGKENVTEGAEINCTKRMFKCYNIDLYRNIHMHTYIYVIFIHTYICTYVHMYILYIHTYLIYVYAKVL